MNKQLLGLAGAVAVAAVLGVLVSGSDNSEVPDAGPVLSDFAAQAANVTRLNLSNAQGDLLQAEYRDGTWYANNVGQYPVQQDQVVELLQQLLDANKVEAKTAKAKNYHRLGLQDLSAEDSQAVLLDVATPEQQWQLLVGKLAKGASGRYARLPQEQQSWLLSTDLDLPVDKKDWLLQPILPFEIEQVQSLQRLGNSGWTMSKAEQEQEHFALAGVDGEPKLKYPSVLDAVVSSLVSLNFDDLAPVDAALWQQPTTAKLLLTTWDQQQLEVQISAPQEGDYHIRFLTDDVQAYWGRWQYLVSEYSAQQLDKQLVDFVQEASVPVEQEKQSE